MVRHGAGMGLLVAGLLIFAGLSAAEEPQERTIRGQIIDPSTYLREGKPQAVAAQTFEAIDGGQSPVLLEEGTGNLYLILGESPGQDPAAAVYDYLNESVGVTGKVYERGGMRGVVITGAVESTAEEALEEAPAEPAP